jgi:DNA-binding NarL/FixJ family response regulator
MLPRAASVFLVTANRLLRETLASLLSNKGRLNVCGVSPCVPDVCDAIVASSAEILILDAIRPNQPGGGLLLEVLRRAPSVKVVLIDMEEDRDVFLEFARAGAAGYLLKDASAEDVLSTIRSVSRGQSVYPSQMCLPIFRSIPDQATPAPSAHLQFDLGLTRRQQQLLPLIAQGLTNKEIASHLNLSEQTIKNHIHNMLRRAGVNTRLEVLDVTRLHRFPQPVPILENAYRS